MTSSNPLLRPSDPQALADFSSITPEHVEPAMTMLLDDATKALELAVSDRVKPDYDALSAVLDVATERLGWAWSAVSHLHSVLDTPPLRAAYNDLLPRITAFYTALGSDQRLFHKYKTLDLASRAPGAATLSMARRKALDNALRDFRLSGAELEGEAKNRYAEIQDRLAELQQQYAEHVLDATDAFGLEVSAEQLAGVPADVLSTTRVLTYPSSDLEGSTQRYRLTLQYPVYGPVMQYAHDRHLREALYRAYITRASEIGPSQWNNSALMTEILRLRQEEAQLLGQPSYAHLSLVPKMASSPEEVISFLRDLAEKARPYALKDLSELTAYAAERLGLAQLEPWDLAYASEQLKMSRYAFSEQEVKAYLTEPKVLSGLFGLVETLFEVRILPDAAPTWHPDVRFFRVERDGRLLAQFYLDPYARKGKQSGAWMDEARARWLRSSASLQTPVAHLVCNFAAPVDGRPALLTHDDLITLFHEFGHGLHLMLTQVSDLGVSGLSGVEWDAVELPSQFMENFCWEWEVLSGLTAHVDTGEPMPRELFRRMLAARNFQSGLQTMRQVEMALFDMRLHLEPESAERIQSVVDEVRAEVSLVPTAPFNRFQHAFSHIFAGGYSAGYYSYKWAEVLSADAYSAFEESPGGVLDRETGRRLREAIFEAGGSRSAMENFKSFRGREPRIEALLRHQGMAPKPASNGI